MTVYTGKGDDGYTKTPLYGRVSKASLPIRVLGELDELNCWLGLVRCRNELKKSDRVVIATVQGHVRAISCEVSCGDAGGAKQRKVLRHGDCAFLSGGIRERERKGFCGRGFRVPGGNEVSAVIDIARTMTRRAERSMAALSEQSETLNTNIPVYLNRLSDLLYIMAGQYDISDPGSVPGNDHLRSRGDHYGL